MPPASPDILEAPARAATHATDLPYIDAALAENYPAELGLPLRHSYTWQHLNRGRHAEVALRAGVMRCIDPGTGESLDATTAFVLPGEWLGIVYRFAGSERFDLVTSSFDQAKIGLWFPDRDVFVTGRVEPNWGRCGTQAVEALREHEAAATRRPVPAGTRNRLYLGFNGNLGHFMWNDLSGLEAVIGSVGAGAIGSVVAGPHAVFPVDGIFPELAAAGVPVEVWRRPLPPCIACPDHLPLRVTGNRLSRGLRRRIVAWAIAQQREHLDTAAALNTAGVNLWFNLRLHNKSWVDQVQGIAMLARTFLDVMPPGQTLTLLLDGTPDTSALAQRIAQDLDGQARVVDITAVPLARSVLLAGLVDLHICVIGSGLTIPHWVMGRRGLAHSNRPHLHQQRWWNGVAEGAHDVAFIPTAAVTDLDGPLTPDASYVDYRIDPGALIEQLDRLWRQLDVSPRRSGFEQMLRLAAEGRDVEAADRLISV